MYSCIERVRPRNVCGERLQFPEERHLPVRLVAAEQFVATEARQGDLEPVLFRQSCRIPGIHPIYGRLVNGGDDSLEVVHRWFRVIDETGTTINCSCTLSIFKIAWIANDR